MMFRSWLVAAGSAVAFSVGGCGKPPAPDKTAGPTAPREVENPWARAVATLRKETDLGTCRRVMADLTAAAAATGGAAALVTPEGDRKTVQAALGLTDDEVKEIAGAGFTSLDAAHLTECFYLRDAAATLDADGLPPLAKAERALAWVGRQVQLAPASVGRQGQLAPVGSVTPQSPANVLRRGRGCGLDRAVVLIALCRQLDLDAFLVGPPAANAWPPELPAGKALPEPFWAVAVRDGTGLHLFDPIRALPVPGPTAGKPATLAEAKANPDLLKPWAADGKGVLPTAEEIKASVPYPAVPLSAVSARMAAFQKSAGGELGVRAAVNWAAVAKAAEGCGSPPVAWNPPGFPLTPVRVQREFLPVADGGVATPELQNRARLELLPPSLGRIEELTARAEAGLRDRLRGLVLSAYARAVIESGPRERLQRGLYLDATQLLIKVRDEFRAMSERADGDPARSSAVTDWLAQMNLAYQKLSEAKVDAPADTIRQMEADLQKKWAEKSSEAVILMIVTGYSAGPIQAEATYLLALTRHEQAERAQAAAGKGAAAKEAWAEADGWWERYLPLAAAQDKVFPGRAAHAAAMAARAKSLK